MLKQEEAWNKKVTEGMVLLGAHRDIASKESKGKVVQAFWMRETCLLAISELLAGCEDVSDAMFENGKDTLSRILTPPRDNATEATFGIIAETVIVHHSL